MPDIAPEQLFHYTGAKGLISIVRTRELWATHISYFSDAMEYQVALNLARELILAEVRPRDAQEQRVLDLAIELLAAQNPIGPRVYVAALTENLDQLSQWRGYTTPGDAYSSRRSLLLSAARLSVPL